MNLQLHRKQIVFLGCAMMLAVSTYWIPGPQTPLPQSMTQAGTANSLAPAEESVLIDGNWSQPPVRHRALI